MPVCSDWHGDDDAGASTPYSNRHNPIQSPIGGFLEQRSTNPQGTGDLSGTEMPIPRMFLLRCTGPRCVLPKLAPSTAPYEKPMGSASAQLRNLAGHRSWLKPANRIRLRLSMRASTDIAMASR